MGLLMLCECLMLLLFYVSVLVFDDLLIGLLFVLLFGYYCGVVVYMIVFGELFVVLVVSGIWFIVIVVDSKLLFYLLWCVLVVFGDNIVLLIEDVVSGWCVFYVLGFVLVIDEVCVVMDGVDFVLVDGMFWIGIEMIDFGLLYKYVVDMGYFV